MAWDQLAPKVIQRLTTDLQLTPQQAAGIVGQLGHESAGLQAINEYQPVVPGSRGGFGWAQWTGPRRQQFEAFAADRKMDIADPEANYQFLLHELTATPEGRVLDSLRQAPDAQSAGRIFTDRFLRPGVPAYESRASWTERALNTILPAAQAGTLPVDGPWTRYAQQGQQNPTQSSQQMADGPWTRYQRSVPAQQPQSGTIEYSDGRGDSVRIPAQNQDRTGASGEWDQEPTLDQQIRASAPGRFLQGASDIVTGGAQLLVNSLPSSVVDAVNTGTQAINYIPVVGDVARAVGIRPATAEQLNQEIAADEKRYQEARQATGQDGMDWWRLGGNIAGSAPLMAAAPGAAATGWGRVGVGAAQGAMMGGLQPVYEGPVAENSLYQMATGGAAGAVASGVGNALSRLVSPRSSTNPQVQTLLDEGITPTPGQIMGGTARTVEDKAVSVPILGDAIRGARNRGTQELNRAALNRAVEPLGRTVTATGREGLRQVDDIISQAYDDILPRITFRADGQFAQDIGRLQQMVQTLPDERISQFDRILRDKVIGRLTPQGIADGQNFKAMESELGRLASGLMRATDVDQRELGLAIRELQRSLRDTLQRGNPQVSQELGVINQAYALLTRLQTAAGGAGATDGIFTPAQLSAAVRVGDRSMRRGAFARGEALMQDLSDAAKGVMQGTIPNSGTADRLLLSGGAALVSPATAAGLGGASLPYLPGLNRLAAIALARRPNFAPRVAEAISQGFVPAPLVAAPLANQMLNQ